jgi:predicted Rossmann-fold nucleotide-binding protein
MMEMVTWNQLGIHKKPIVVLNGMSAQHLFLTFTVKGYYSPIVTLLQQARDEGFIQPINLSLIQILDVAEGEDCGKVAIEALENWKWEVSIV